MSVRQRIERIEAAMRSSLAGVHPLPVIRRRIVWRDPATEKILSMSTEEYRQWESHGHPWPPSPDAWREFQGRGGKR
ncbi:MAG: hypothetical protein HY716_04060 [Planctomycetes bacterium]|nr:hypothetical protein [Planctomycetota bacterium]